MEGQKESRGTRELRKLACDMTNGRVGDGDDKTKRSGRRNALKVKS